MKTIRTLGIVYFIGSYLFVLTMVLANSKNILIDTLILIGFFLITLGFLLFFLKINKEV